MVTQGANVRLGVLVATSVALSAQIVSLVASFAFFLFASSEVYRKTLAVFVVEALYSPYQEKWYRRSRALEVSPVCRFRSGSCLEMTILAMPLLHYC